MRTLLGNTFMHMVGEVLESPRDGSIRRSRALATFHLAEHIMFDDEMAVSIAPGARLYERSASVLADLEAHGVVKDGGRSVLELRAFDLSYHQKACDIAAARLAALLNLGRYDALESWGEYARRRQIGEGLDFSALAVSGRELVPLAHLVDEYRDVPTAEAAYMVRSCPALRAHLEAITHSLHGISDDMQATLFALFRLYINQELAGAAIDGGLYAPTPQRVALAHQVNRLHEIELKKEIRMRAELTGVAVEGAGDQAPRFGRSAQVALDDEISRVLLEMGRPVRVSLPSPDPLDSFPLPLLAFHLLKSQKKEPVGPYEILERARDARDSREAVKMRKHLSEWQVKLANTATREATFAEIRAISEEIKAELAPGKASMNSVFQFPVGLFPPRFNVTADALDLWKGFKAAVAWVHHKRFQRQFLASVARTVTEPDEFDGWFTKALDRKVIPD